jgi:phage shock protein A
MGIFRRVSDIVSANLNEMVERFESPETMLRQAIREMDAALSRTLEAAARVIADERLLADQIARHRVEATDLHRRAGESLARGDEAGARRALMRRSDHEKLVAALDDQLAFARTTGSRMRRQLDAMRVRRAEAESTLHVLLARQRTVEAQRQLHSRQSDFQADETGFARFDRMRRKIERSEAETEALLDLGGGQLSDVDESDADRELEDELRALRKECPAPASE